MVTTDRDGTDDERDAYSRRRLLSMGSAATAAMVAGCSGGEGEGSPSETPGSTEVEQTVEDTPTEASGGEPVTTELSSHMPSWKPSDHNVNIYSPPGGGPAFLNYLWWEPTLYRNANGAFCYYTVDEVAMESACDVRIKFNDQHTWWDGTPVTARDLYVQHQINQYQQYGDPADAPNQWELVDDYTIKETRSAPINPTIRRSAMVQSPVTTKADFYQKYLERYRDASTEKEVEQVTTDLTELQVSVQQAVDEGLGNGMWIPTDWDPQRVIHKKYSDHPRADWTNLDTWRWELVSGNQKVTQAFKDGVFDMGELNFKLLPKNDNIENIAKFSLPGVPKMSFNFHNKHLARRKVRQAIAYLIDHKELRSVLQSNHGTPYQSHPYIMGMSKRVAENWFDDDYLDSLIDYGATAKIDKAKATMKEAGYTMEGDRWVGPDGDEFSGIRYMTPPWSIYQTIEKYMTSKMEEFGIGTEMLMPNSSNFYKRLNDTYKFDIAHWFHYNTHPAHAFSAGSLRGLDNYRAKAKTVESSGDCSVARKTPELTGQRSDRLNHPIRPEFPSEVGSEGSSTEKLYPIKWNNVMEQSQSRDEIVELGQKMGWYYNWQVPHIGFYEEVWNYWGNRSEFTFRNNHDETDQIKREHLIPNEDAFQMKGHVSAKVE